jgi:hypothetical protein
MRLIDAWFEASFIYGIAFDGSGFSHGKKDLTGAQGLWLWCPCGYGKLEYPLAGGRPHAVLVPFALPLNAPPPPAAFGPVNAAGARPRWKFRGTGLHDLTISPSIDVGAGTTKCSHGFITNGEIT